MRPPRTPRCKNKLAEINRLLVSCASQARMHTTHDPHHEKVADRRGSLGNSPAADRNLVSLFCVFLVSRLFCSLSAAPVNGQSMEKRKGRSDKVQHRMLEAMFGCIAAYVRTQHQTDRCGSRIETCTENFIRALAAACEHGISFTKPVAILGHAHAQALGEFAAELLQLAVPVHRSNHGRSANLPLLHSLQPRSDHWLRLAHALPEQCNCCLMEEQVGHVRCLCAGVVSPEQLQVSAGHGLLIQVHDEALWRIHAGTPVCEDCAGQPRAETQHSPQDARLPKPTKK